MYSQWQIIFSGLAITGVGFMFGKRLGVVFFLSFGMMMIFNAWLNFLNFDGSHPSDQPFVQNYSVSRSDEDRLWRIIGDVNSMSSSDWQDYHRCRLHNVCVRRFAR
jgi:hypothetical protein